MLCVFNYKRALCFVKCLYAFKSEINLMNGTELLIFVLFVCKLKPFDSKNVSSFVARYFPIVAR